jgi:hypothetical protein
MSTVSTPSNRRILTRRCSPRLNRGNEARYTFNGTCSEIADFDPKVLGELMLAMDRERDALKKELAQEQEKNRTVILELKKEREKSQTLIEVINKEQERNRCQICYTSSRDAIILPCLHLQYCNECLRQHQARHSEWQSECPTCRSKIRGVLHCKFFGNA